MLEHTHEITDVFSLAGAGHVLLDALVDTLKVLPFLFAAFLLLEFLEKHAGEALNRFFLRAGRAGPLVGAALGCVPQCGFSVLCANLYAGGVVTRGTLLAVFLSTSDEAVILLAAEPGRYRDILWLLLCKVAVAVLAGYAVDLLAARSRRKSPAPDIHDLCDHEHCNCHKHKGIVVPALMHTVKIFAFLLAFSAVLGFFVAAFGAERVERLLLANSPLQPLLAGLVGLVPNCAASVLLTQLYLDGALSFGSVIAGLCTGAGAGLLVLFRENRRVKDNLLILGLLYGIGAAAGLLLQAAGT